MKKSLLLIFILYMVVIMISLYFVDDIMSRHVFSTRFFFGIFKIAINNRPLEDQKLFFHNYFDNIIIEGKQPEETVMYLGHHHLIGQLDQFAYLYLPENTRCIIGHVPNTKFSFTGFPFVNYFFDDYIFGSIINYMINNDKCYVFDKNNGASHYENIFNICQKSIEDGNNIFAFPEGRKSRSVHKLNEDIRSGLFRIAFSEKIKICPFLVSTKGHKRWAVNKKEIRMCYLPIIDPSEFGDYKSFMDDFVDSCNAKISEWN